MNISKKCLLVLIKKKIDKFKVNLTFQLRVHIRWKTIGFET